MGIGRGTRTRPIEAVFLETKVLAVTFGAGKLFKQKFTLEDIERILKENDIPMTPSMVVNLKLRTEKIGERDYYFFHSWTDRKGQTWYKLKYHRADRCNDYPGIGDGPEWFG